MIKKIKKERVFVAMSGGVDSSVAALLLKEQGYDVTGVFMRNWHADIHEGFGDCPWKRDREDAQKVCEILGISFKMWDFSKEYYQDVVEYFFREYKAGRTPNPDVMCNKYIKFGQFLEKALEEGAHYIATGHYTRLRRKETRFAPDVRSKQKQEKNRIQIPNSKLQTRDSKLPVTSYQLVIGKDPDKDQSYFLWTLTQEQLRHTLFPIGEYYKPKVRAIAKKAGLPNAQKPDSQGICFIGKVDLREFLKTRLPEKIGVVITADGRPVGEHSGAYFYTEGQRHGFDIDGRGIPYYVIEKDIKKNLVKVVPAYDNRLFSYRLSASNINWIAGKIPKFPFSCQARIRYRQALQYCRVEALTDADLTWYYADSPCQSAYRSTSVRVVFEEKQRAIARGQSIVFYQEEECLGGGIID